MCGLHFSRSQVFQLLSFSTSKKLMIVGLAGSGKSTILYQINLTEQKPITIPCSAIFQLELLTIANTQITTLTLGRCKHQEKLWQHFFDDLDAIIFAIDAHDEMVQFSKEELQKFCNNEKTKDIPLMILANKSDLKNLDLEEIKELYDIKLLEESQRPCVTKKCCALQHQSIIQILNWIQMQLNDKN